jgi:N-acetylglucosamine-6-phosphate deacetylase
LSLADRLWVSVIADGVHVPFYVLGNFIRAIGTERCVVVTDAMAAAGCGPGRHRLGRWEIEMGEDGAAWSPDHSHLVGAATTMPQLHRNLRDQLGLSEADCQRLLAINPSRAIGITVAAGSRAPPPPGA